MKSVIRYKTTAEAADENQRLVEEVYRELAAKKPARLQYATFRLEDGVSFMHVALIEPDGPSPLADIAAFSEFLRDLPGRCVEPPVAVAATVVGSFRFFAS